MTSSANTDAMPRPPRYDGAANRKRVLDAALKVFARVGFAGASVRMIAAEAGIEQGHLTYYFPSKMALWRGVVEAFAPEPLRRVKAALPASAGLDAASAARLVLPELLRCFADNSELTRLMLQELSVNSDRSAWLANHFAQPVWAAVQPLFQHLDEEGHLRGTPPELAYFTMIGSALVTFGNAELIHRFTTQDPLSRDAVEQAIEHIVGSLVSR
ncbi:AcrR family transcriptional regulator [Novosphingobium capsulatum]|uniref:AcrR family transcriptional regulator n=2 Tax=Novosphingobium capsulatum TaxID=13688 RepID=A0ABU1MMM5_9SPHN|nr:AcrR family transcriptional regulator [Novosphingobium capsulatum]